MKLNTGLWQRQSLKLNMTQQLTQAIELLQYSSQELNAYLESKALENPLLQLEPVSYEERTRKRNQEYNGMSIDWIEEIAVQQHSLWEHLNAQLNLKTLNHEDRNTLSLLFDSLDENGYLPSNIESLFRVSDLSTYIEMLQSLEPAGIGARNLKECLLLQIQRDTEAPEHAHSIIEHHFAAFCEKTWKTITKELGITLSDIQLTADYVKTLNPRPGARFTSEAPQYIRPEMNVTRSKDGLEVQLVDGSVMKIKYNSEYDELIASSKDKEGLKFMRDKKQEFQWLLKMLDQRKTTLMKVGKCLVERQEAFFRYGPKELKPLTLKEVAETIGVHESTISRAVRGKYIGTPCGTYEMKALFVSGVGKDEDAVSSEGIKAEIMQMVTTEDKKKPLSDQAIAVMLQEKGLHVSRRTVAKYRDQLNIPSSTRRKRYE
ncbi:RNA polymerase factor sigma-54 [Bacillus sp. SG-1]|uniref:RNA polymerase factor sigma-54 n=1 Tax=Bacillus sp. SG-1 TaxID=161544 RepID=UPI0001544850|nr:RNA polymerase factor sigma-54 [Bacillus sp. SG-1]EDL64651.1 DNA-directed RNA polymerase subunit N [Bacillus sp. SG-1]